MIKRKETELDKIYSDAMDLMIRIKAECENLPQYQLLIQNVSKLCEGLNEVILNKIKGTDENN